MSDDLLARAGRMLTTAATIRETDPAGAVSLAASVVVMAHVAVLRVHGQCPTPGDEHHLGTDIGRVLGESLIDGDRLTELLDARDGLVTVDPDAAQADARSALERAKAVISE